MKIECWMDSNILVSKYVERDVDGEEVYDDPVEVCAYIKPMEMDGRTAAGNQRGTATEVYTLFCIELMDRVWFPCDYTDVTNYKVNGLEVQSVSEHKSIIGCDKYYKAIV